MHIQVLCWTVINKWNRPYLCCYNWILDHSTLPTKYPQ